MKVRPAWSANVWRSGGRLLGAFPAQGGSRSVMVSGQRGGCGPCACLWTHCERCGSKVPGARFTLWMEADDAGRSEYLTSFRRRCPARVRAWAHRDAASLRDLKGGIEPPSEGGKDGESAVPVRLGSTLRELRKSEDDSASAVGVRARAANRGALATCDARRPRSGRHVVTWFVERLGEPDRRVRPPVAGASSRCACCSR